VYIAADTVNCIRGVDNDAAFAQHFYYLLNTILGRVIGMNAEQRSRHDETGEWQVKQTARRPERGKVADVADFCL
jgi:hypothetical protein